MTWNASLHPKPILSGSVNGVPVTIPQGAYLRIGEPPLTAKQRGRMRWTFFYGVIMGLAFARLLVAMGGPW